MPPAIRRPARCRWRRRTSSDALDGQHSPARNRCISTARPRCAGGRIPERLSCWWFPRRRPSRRSHTAPSANDGWGPATRSRGSRTPLPDSCGTSRWHRARWPFAKIPMRWPLLPLPSHPRALDSRLHLERHYSFLPLILYAISMANTVAISWA